MVTVPLCCFPTKVIFVDDDPKYLDSLSVNLLQDSYSFHLYDDPIKALEYINGQKSTPNFMERFITTDDSSKIDKHHVSLDIPNIQKIPSDPNRFDQISVLCVDYSMPSMNGLEFLSKVKMPNLKKILLTGQADEKIAIEAFNRQLINAYIRKSDSNSLKKIDYCCRRLQTDFFTDILYPLTRAIPHNHAYPLAINDTAFVNYFKTLIEEKNIKEYYAIHSVGSFLLIDKNEKIFTLYTQNIDQVQSHYDDIEDLDESTFPQSLKSEIEKKEMILCFPPNNTEFFNDPSKWGPYFKKSMKISGTNDFFVALAEGPPEGSSVITGSLNKYVKDLSPFFFSNQ